MDVAEQNRLRRMVRSKWDEPKDRPTPLFHLVDDEADRDDHLAAYVTIASELGIRHVRLDLHDGFTDEHRATLSRKTPRLVVLLNLDGVPSDIRPSLHDQLCEGGRTLPIIVAFMPVDRMADIAAGWKLIQADAAAAKRES